MALGTGDTTLSVLLQLRIDDLESKLSRAEMRLKGTEAKASAFAKQFAGYMAAAFSVDKLLTFVGASIDVAKQLDSTNKALQIITGSSQEFAATKSMLAEWADELGINLLSLTQEYMKFYAASKETALGGEQAEQIFYKVAKSAAVLGLTADQTSGIFLALTQIMSKGKLMAQEVRQQLGERLPGALAILSKSMGVTSAELDKMMEQGQVMAVDVLPQFADAIMETYSADKVDRVETMTAAQERLKTAWIQSIDKIETSTGVLSETYIEVFEVLSDIITVIGHTIEGLVLLGSELKKVTPLWIQSAGALARELLSSAADQARADVDELSTSITGLKQQVIDVAKSDLARYQEKGYDGLIGKLRETTQALGIYADVFVEEAAAMKAAMDEYFKTETLDEFIARMDAAQETLKLKDFLKNAPIENMSALMGTLATDVEGLAETWAITGETLTPWDLAHLTDGLENLPEEAVDVMKETNKMVKKEIAKFDWGSTLANAMSSSIIGAADAVGSAIGSLVSGADQDFMKDFKKVLGSSLQAIGSAMIAFGVAHSAFIKGLKSGPLGGPIAIAAGAALVVAGAALSASYKEAAGGVGTSGGSSRGGFTGNVVNGQSVQFEPVVLTFNGKDFEAKLQQVRNKR